MAHSPNPPKAVLKYRGRLASSATNGSTPGGFDKNNAESSKAPPTESATRIFDVASSDATALRFVVPKPSHALPTDRMGFGKQLEVLRAFGHLGLSGGTVSNSEVARIVGLTAPTTSLINPFFNGAGLLTRSQDGQLPSTATIDFARMYAWDPQLAPTKLGPQLKDSWFGVALLPRLRFRPHTKTEALAVLADAAGAGKDRKAQLAAVLDWLEFAKLIAQEGGQVRAVVDVGTAGVLSSDNPPIDAKPPAGNVDDERIPYTCKFAGTTIQLTLPRSFTKSDVRRLSAFLETQADDYDVKPGGEK